MHLRLWAVVTVLLTSIIANSAQAAAGKPNIVLIIADDLGWKDVGYNGSEIRTPHIDQLAEKGVRLDRFYAHPFCTATRASLMTGQTAIRIGVQQPILIAGKAGIPLHLKFLPEFLQDAGYQTALSGKWHLGHAKKEMLPLARGFDSAYGSLTGGFGYWDRTSGGGYDWHRNEKTLREEGYATHLIAEEAIRVIKERDRNKPLFLYTAFSAPHLPNEAPEETIKKYSHIEDEHRRVHAAMVDEMDQEIGRIIQTLEQENMTDNTIVWFLSDNGGTHMKYGRAGMGKIAQFIEDQFGSPAPIDQLELIRSAALDGGSDNGPFKGGKGSVTEGGVLVPAAVYWPNSISVRPVKERVTINDLFPTLLAIAGVIAKADQPIDGTDQSALFFGTSTPAPSDYMTESAGRQAYYMDQWKLRHDGDSEFKLFDLEADPFEDQDLSTKHPDILAQLKKKLAAVPRGERINIPFYRIFLDPEIWGGEETREPWADIVE